MLKSPQTKCRNSRPVSFSYRNGWSGTYPIVRLAGRGSVRPEKPEELPFADRQVQVVDGDERTEFLRDMGDLDRRVHRRFPEIVDTRM
jgi:hypothetical protein